MLIFSNFYILIIKFYQYETFNFFLSFIFSLSIYSQGVVFSAQNGASLTISDNASVNFNGMKLSPSSDLTLTDNIVELSDTPLSGAFSSTTRVYSFNNNISFSGDLKVYYDDSVEELNGIDEANLNIAILGSDSNWWKLHLLFLMKLKIQLLHHLIRKRLNQLL